MATDRIPFGMGGYGSRSLAVGGSAIAKAVDKVIEKGRIIAAHLLEASEADMEFKDGKYTVAGTDNEKTLAKLRWRPMYIIIRMTVWSRGWRKRPLIR